MTLAERWRLVPWRERIILAVCLAVAIAFAWYQRTQPTALVEKPALTPEQEARAMDAAGEMIRAFGYDCQEVDAMQPYMSGREGWTVNCNRFRYTFYIENHGGKFSVKAD